MPGLKRPRRSLDAEDELSNGGSETDTSKRQRTSSLEPSNESTIGDDINDDSGDDELSDAQVEIYNETQAARRSDENQAVENGVIEEITMINFMCHKHLTVKMGPLINFIIGHNGSGKSAALTALALNLGGKTKFTDRGTSLKSFIQNDKDQATLIVKIKNQGENGYRQDEFGDTITIERQFSRNGTSGFKIKSQSGKIISTKKSDVDDITDHYGLQMDNPLTVLTQDMARQFLNNSSPADKYKFFLRGVQLEQLKNDYDLIHEQVETLTATYEERETYVVQLDQELQEARNKYRATSRLSDLREKLEQYRMKMVWCQVVNQERKEEDCRKELDELQADIQAAHQDFEAAGREFEEADTTKNDLQQQLETVQTARQPILDRESDAQKAQQKTKSESTDLVHDQRTAMGQFKKTKERIVEKQQEIAAEEKRLEERSGSSTVQRLQELESKRAVAGAASLKAKEHAKAESALTQAIHEATNAQTKHKSARQPLQAQVDETQKRLQELQNTNSRQKIYGPEIDRLIKAIKQDSGFRNEPIGPMGSYVQLKKPAWSSVLEKFFGNSLNGFVVSSKEDQERLTGLTRRLKCNVPISIVNPAPIDPSNNEPSSEFDTVLRVIDVEHPLVTKYMIINHNIEQVILIENMKEARKVMFGPRIRNVKACFSLSYNDSTTGERFAYTASGVATSFADGWRGHPRMKASIQDRVNHENQVLIQQQQALREHGNQLETIRRNVEEAKKALARHKTENADLKTAAATAAEEVQELNDLLEQDTSNQGRLDELIKGLAELETEKSRLEETYQQSVVNLDANKARRAADLKLLKAIGKDLEAANKQVTNLEIRLHEAETTRANALIKKNELGDVITSKEFKRDNPDDGLQGALQNVKRLITDFIAKASVYGPRVAIADHETMEYLTASYQKTQQNIELQERRLGGSITELRAAYEEAKAKHDSVVQQLKDDKELQQMLLFTLSNRRNKWQEFRKHITMRARLGFKHLLSERAFRGELRVNHRAELLDIEIQPDETRMGKNMRTTKTLSGGEKSFSQICLIVALWEAIGAPIRCLDEFDVFMDSVNRDLAMRILIDAARNSHGRQFILITPQSMSSLADGPDVKVHKMRDPDRTGNQTTLPFVS